MNINVKNSGCDSAVAIRNLDSAKNTLLANIKINKPFLMAKAEDCIFTVIKEVFRVKIIYNKIFLKKK